MKETETHSSYLNTKRFMVRKHLGQLEGDRDGMSPRMETIAQLAPHTNGPWSKAALICSAAEVYEFSGAWQPCSVLCIELCILSTTLRSASSQLWLTVTLYHPSSQHWLAPSHPHGFTLLFSTAIILRVNCLIFLVFNR